MFFNAPQENVSCLNTALVFLMFALDKGYLPLYLKAFRSEEAALKKPGFILHNLRYGNLQGDKFIQLQLVKSTLKLYLLSRNIIL